MPLLSTTYPKIVAATPLENYRLCLVFSNHTTKIYDCSELLTHPVFSLLHDQAMFRAVQVAHGGYGVFWNDDIDLSESELWLHGESVEEHSEPSSHTQVTTTKRQVISA